MRTLCLGVSALCLTATAAGAASLPYQFWSGLAVIDKVTAACKNGGQIAVADVAVSNYRALQGVDGEPSNPGISFVFTRSAMALFYASGPDANTMNGNGNFNGHVIKGSVTTIPNPTQNAFQGTYKFKISPTTITSATDAITIDGQVTNWRNVKGCTVTFRAAYRQAAQ
jgi:hypothetical protein